MKKAILLNDLTDADIIDSSIYQEYVSLLKKDISSLWTGSGCTKPYSWFDSSAASLQDVYKILDVQYQFCPKTQSCFVNPRLNTQALRDFYRDSQACQFWRKQLCEVDEDQLYYIYGSRVSWITELVDEYLDRPSVLVDLETKYPFLLKHIENQKIFSTMGTLDPLLFEKENQLSSRVLQDARVSTLEGSTDVFTAFETLERMAEPHRLFSLAAKFCRPGGLLLLTTATCSGFEYQVLKEHAPNLNPINRMNLMSLEFIVDLIQRHGFELIELSTPGRLDVEIMRKTLERKPDLPVDDFWKYILHHRDEKTWQGLQNFLQQNRLSSHVRIAARKNNG
ncbi:MAG: class I SAM-dependent methyltransferase [Candidatus Omnitrophica bacterium]|nr:class I SAM-dependent methyltransferase [Candidatus Omnitrophota bacterium]